MGGMSQEVAGRFGKMLVRVGGDLQRNDCLWLSVHGVGRVRRCFRVRRADQ